MGFIPRNPALDDRPQPLRAAAEETAVRHLVASVVLSLVGFGVITVSVGDALTGLLGLLPGLINAVTTLLTAVGVVNRAEPEVTPVSSPRARDGARLIAVSAPRQETTARRSGTRRSPRNTRWWNDTGHDDPPAPLMAVEPENLPALSDPEPTISTSDRTSKGTETSPDVRMSADPPGDRLSPTAAEDAPAARAHDATAAAELDSTTGPGLVGPAAGPSGATGGITHAGPSGNGWESPYPAATGYTPPDTPPATGAGGSDHSSPSTTDTSGGGNW